MARTTSYKQQNGSTRWKITGYLGTNPYTKKQIYFRRSGFKTETGAFRAYEQAVNDVQKNGFQNKKLTTFRQIYEMWLQTYKNTVKESSYVKLKQKFNKHILPAFGDKNINSIEVYEVQQFANHMRDINTQYKEYISNVSRIFKFAISQNFATRNPVNSITIPRRKNQSVISSKINYFDAKQLKSFLAEAHKNERFEIYAFFYLMAHTGCRTGEVLGLQYGDIDEHQTLKISRTLTRGEHRRLYLEAPKTSNSRREIPLDDETTAILNQWHSLQIKLLKINGETDAGAKQLIFTNEKGQFINLFTPRLWMQRICKHAKLPILSPHALRHTFATLLLSQNANYKMISALLGHSSVAFTLDTYAGIYQKDKLETINKLNSLIDK